MTISSSSIAAWSEFELNAVDCRTIQLEPKLTVTKSVHRAVIKVIITSLTVDLCNALVAQG